MSKLEPDAKKKLEKFLESLEGHKTDTWKKILEEHEEEFEAIKTQIKQKHKELVDLVRKRRVITITDEEFKERTKNLQQELYELESKILKLRLQTSK